MGQSYFTVIFCLIMFVLGTISVISHEFVVDDLILEIDMVKLGEDFVQVHLWTQNARVPSGGYKCGEIEFIYDIRKWKIL